MQRILNYPTNRSYFGEVKTPYKDKLFLHNDSIFEGFIRDLFSKFSITVLKKKKSCSMNNFIFNVKLLLWGLYFPTLADIFLAHHEENWLNDCPLQFKPTAATLMILLSDYFHVLPFRRYLNDQHIPIEFTSETEIKYSFIFLDVKIIKKNNQFSTDLYRKPIFTGLVLKYNSSITQILYIKYIYFLMNTIPTIPFRRVTETFDAKAVEFMRASRFCEVCMVYY